jgi:hypothetical protein
VNPRQCFGSVHPGVCLFVFADASVRAVKSDTDIPTLTYLCTPNDGNVFRLD